MCSSARTCAAVAASTSRTSRPSPSDDDDGLEVRDVEAATAAHVLADEHIVHAHHVVAGLRELRLLLFVHAARRLMLPRAPQPAHLVVAALSAVRASVGGALRLRFLVEEISLVHNRYRVPGPGVGGLFAVTRRLFSSLFLPRAPPRVGGGVCGV